MAVMPLWLAKGLDRRVRRYFQVRSLLMLSVAVGVVLINVELVGATIIGTAVLGLIATGLLRRRLLDGVRSESC